MATLNPADNPPVLIIDDDQRFRQLVAELLKGHGYRVVEARSAKEATASIASEEPCLIICDYRLPDQDGLTWVGRYRESGSMTPIVLISGIWLDKQTFDVARNIHRISLILRKPIVPLLFVSQLKSLLPSRRMVVPPKREGASRGDTSTTVAKANTSAALDRVRQAYIAELPKHGKTSPLPLKT